MGTQESATQKGPRLVYCVKLGRELPGLEKPPFPGALGQRIYEQISQKAWDMWPAQSTLIINHYGLNMADPEARKILREQMEEFFFGEDAKMPEACSCGEVLKGIILPDACPLFGDACTPEHPVGPCMVSSEGSCAAFYKYERVS